MGISMKMRVFCDPKLKENRVDIYYNRKDAEVKDLLAYLQAGQELYGTSERERRRLHLQEIYYVEVVDRHCFVYLKQEVYEVEETLRSFLERYGESGFLQIGKSTAVNMHRIEKIRPDFNMRMHLTLENGEELVLSRAFKKEFLNYLKQKKEALQ